MYGMVLICHFYLLITSHSGIFLLSIKLLLSLFSKLIGSKDRQIDFLLL